VSGALIFAKTSKGKERMRQLFTERKVAKTYLALVNKCPDPFEADLENWMYKNREKNIVEVIKGERPGAVRARTIYKTLGQVGKYYLVRLHPVTGKSHQLRLHMSFIGSPIIGDVKYGGANIHDPKTIVLHCRQMEFIHPVQQVPIVLRATLPKHSLWNRYRDEIESQEKECNVAM
jgi:23S rRNA pseudouridine1911/1915/1917 synthase